MEIISCKSDLMGSISYIIKEGNSVIIIDPNGAEADVLKQINKPFIIEYIFLTHEHCDHCAGAAQLRDDYNSKILVSGTCSKNLLNERMNYSRYFEALASVQTKINEISDLKMDPFIISTDAVFNNELKIDWNNHNIYLRETPGHSQGSVSILIDNKYLFAGDSLIWGEKTITKFIGGSKKEFESKTLPWFQSLNPDIYVYPGHLEEFRLSDKLQQPIL